MTEQKGLHSPRCLLTVVVNRLKGILKSNFLICLTPFACRSGQTSSMLGGAQFKATLLDQKALFSNIQCKNDRQQFMANQSRWQAASCSFPVNRDLPLPAHSSTQRPLWAENAVLQEVNQIHKASELSVYAHKLFFYGLSNPNPHLTHTAQWQPLDFPHTMVEHRSWTPSELVKFLKFQRGKLKSSSQKAELWIWRPNHKWSLPYKQYRTVASTRANPPWQGTLVAACSSQRSEHFSLLSVAENWAPLIFSCSHNQSNPFNLSNLHHKRKSYIWTQTEKKIIFTKFVQYTHLIFYGTHCTRRKRAMALKQVYLTSAVITNEDSWKPVFSVLLEHRAFLMAPAKDHRLLFPSGAMMLHLISPDFMLVSF